MNRISMQKKMERVQWLIGVVVMVVGKKGGISTYHYRLQIHTNSTQLSSVQFIHSHLFISCPVADACSRMKNGNESQFVIKFYDEVGYFISFLCATNYLKFRRPNQISMIGFNLPATTHTHTHSMCVEVEEDSRQARNTVHSTLTIY